MSWGDSYLPLPIYTSSHRKGIRTSKRKCRYALPKGNKNMSKPLAQTFSWSIGLVTLQLARGRLCKLFKNKKCQKIVKEITFSFEICPIELMHLFLLSQKSY